MRFVIRWTSPGPSKGSYFRRMTGIGPEFGASLAEAHVFETGEEAIMTSCSHYGFTCSEVDQFDEASYAAALDALNTPQIKMQYLGVLGLLAECSVHMRNSPDTDELRGLIEHAMGSAQETIKNFRWKRILNRFEVEMASPPERKKAS